MANRPQRTAQRRSERIAAGVTPAAQDRIYRAAERLEISAAALIRRATLAATDRVLGEGDDGE